MQARTIPATAPEFNDDEELVLLFCDDKGASEDVGGDKVDEDDRDTDNPGDLEEVGGEEVGGVDIREEDEGLIVLVIKVAVVFSEMLDRLLGREVVVECERVVVERSERVSKTVTVVGVVSPVISSLTYSSNCLTAISFTISAKKN